MPLILDSSILLSRMLADPRAAAARQIIERSVEIGAAAPSLLNFEIIHVLTHAAARGRITWSEAFAQLDAYEAVGIVHDPSPSGEVRLRIARLCEAHRLSGYDAAFLELAIRLSGELATFDDDLADAGNANGLIVHTA